MARDFLVRHSYYVLPIMPYLRETLEFLRLNSEGISIDAAIADAKSSFRWRLGLQHAQPIKKIFNWPAPLLGMPNGIVTIRAGSPITPDRSGFEMLNLETGPAVEEGHLGSITL